VLIYVGEYDWICNWVGNSRWVAALEWSGHAAYTSAEERVWEVDGKGAGRVRSAGPLTFATIRAAGHMVRRPWIGHMQRSMLTMPRRCRTTSRRKASRWSVAGSRTRSSERAGEQALRYRQNASVNKMFCMRVKSRAQAWNAMSSVCLIRVMQ
jgi:hypothetical protein